MEKEIEICDYIAITDCNVADLIKILKKYKDCRLFVNGHQASLTMMVISMRHSVQILAES